MTEKNDKYSSGVVNRPFLEKKPLFGKIQAIEKLEENVLLLMRNNGINEFREKIAPGELIIKGSDGIEKSLFLTPDKLRTFKYNNQYFRGWTAHEDNCEPYPNDPIHSSEMMRKIIQKIAMNYRDAESRKLMEARYKWYLIGAVVVFVALWALYKIAVSQGWVTPIGAEAVSTEQIKQNVTTILTNTGVQV